jgi:hypothetical protein
MVRRSGYSCWRRVSRAFPATWATRPPGRFPCSITSCAARAPSASCCRARADCCRPAFTEAAQELVQLGAEAITTNCGFLSLFQNELAAAAGVPVATSSLMQVRWVQATLPPGKIVGIVTVCGATLTPAHLESVGVPLDTPVVGTENGREFFRVLIKAEKEDMDVAAARQDILDAGRELVTRHPDVGAIVLECTNMPPYSAALQAELGLPVYDIYSMITWFHAGLRPRGFGAAAST